MAITKAEAKLITDEFYRRTCDFFNKRLEPLVGENYKLTVVARCVLDGVDGDIIVSSDDLQLVSETVLKQRSA